MTDSSCSLNAPDMPTAVPTMQPFSWTPRKPVRREKSAISSGCESRPANRSLGRKQSGRSEIERISSTRTYSGTFRNTTQLRHRSWPVSKSRAFDGTVLESRQAVRIFGMTCGGEFVPICSRCEPHQINGFSDRERNVSSMRPTRAREQPLALQGLEFVALYTQYPEAGRFCAQTRRFRMRPFATRWSNSESACFPMRFNCCSS
jgi:hypothetical protein